MKKVLPFAFLTTILGLSMDLQGATSHYGDSSDLNGTRSLQVEQKMKQAVKTKTTKVTTVQQVSEKSVPAPPTLVLVGVAAAVAWGARKLWSHRQGH